MDKKIKLGIIGFGNMGTGHTSNIMGGNCPEVDLVAICDKTPTVLNLVNLNTPMQTLHTLPMP